MKLATAKAAENKAARRALEALAELDPDAIPPPPHIDDAPKPKRKRK